jgi:hypothetical protein
MNKTKLVYITLFILTIILPLINGINEMIKGYEIPYGWSQECIQYDKNETMFNIYISNGTNQIYLKTENLDYFNRYCVEYIPTGVQFCNITTEPIGCTEQHYAPILLEYCNDSIIKDVKLKAVAKEPVCVKWGLVRYE